jgi:hypothetical protein
LRKDSIHTVLTRTAIRTHPYLFVTAQASDGLLALDELRRRRDSGEINQSFRDWCDTEITEPLLLRDVDGRISSTDCQNVVRRVQNLAFAALLFDDDRYRQRVLEQIELLLQPSVWSDCDAAHHFCPVGMRGAAIARVIACAYDWLAPTLSETLRQRIIDTLDERIIQPFIVTMENDMYPTQRRNNWVSVVVGGMGVVMMALHDEHPDAARIIDYSYERMHDMIAAWGDDGEFNESPGYTDSFPATYGYFAAYQYWSRNTVNDLPLLRDAARWTVYAMSPRGGYVNHGDSGVGLMHHWFLPHVIDATDDPVLQWFYEQMAAIERPPNFQEIARPEPIEAISPAEAAWPLGRAFQAHGGLISSRSSWQQDDAASVVHAKATVEGWTHQHNDAGQVLIYGYGRRLIVDPFFHSYPDDYWNPEARFAYRFSSDRGHNIVTVGNHVPMLSSMIAPSITRGRLVAADFDDAQGGRWTINLSEPERGIQATRTVIHALPNIIAVLDDVSTSEDDDITLRWYTGAEPTMDSEGNFQLVIDDVRLVARAVQLDDGERTTGVEHVPADEFTGATGEFPYVRIGTRGTYFKTLTLFAIVKTDTPGICWLENADGWHFGDVSVQIEPELRIGS